MKTLTHTANDSKSIHSKTTEAHLTPTPLDKPHVQMDIMCPEGFELDPKWVQTYLQLAEAIRQAAPQMISANLGVKLLNASTVLDEVLKFPEGTLEREPAYETVEECLGEQGLRLPFIEIDEMMFFALHLVDASKDEKAEFQTWLEQLSPVERMRLEVR